MLVLRAIPMIHEIKFTIIYSALTSKYNLFFDIPISLFILISLNLRELVDSAYRM